jgi:hypothetical protein
MAMYGTARELRDRIDKTGTTDDTTLESIIRAASQAIDNYANRPDGFVADAAASARYYPGSGHGYQWIDECISVSGVAVKDSPSDDEDDYVAWTVGTVGSTTGADVFPASGNPRYPDYQSLPYNLLVIGPNGDYSSFTTGAYTHRRGFRPDRTAVTRGIPTVQVTARWGYASTAPAPIKEASLMQAARWYKRFQSGMADVLASGELGMLLYRQKLDPDVALLLVEGRYIKPATGRY